LITDASQQAVWRHDQAEPFGNNPPDENPSGLGVFEFPLRDEGTYFDKETNLVYNWNRYRDPNDGRFIQADPLGLYGGDLSLYVLRRNNPLSVTDPRGLQAIPMPPPRLPPPGGSAGQGGKSSGGTGSSELDNAIKGGAAANDSKYIECQKCQRYEIRNVIAYTGSDGKSVSLTRCWYYCPDSRTYRYLDVNQLSVFFRCTQEREEASGWSGHGHPSLME
jgi:RHS repeat-associated protein